MSKNSQHISVWIDASREAFIHALPIMLGYVSIGIPAGILEDTIGLTPLMAFIISILYYSGAGQFMVPNMILSGTPLGSMLASISFVNMRQLLYSAAFSPYFERVSKRLTVLFGLTVTDESFGVNMERYAFAQEHPNYTWGAHHATIVNLLSRASWALSNTVGCALGNVLNIPVAIASFAMTAIFICLLVTQSMSRRNLLVIAVTFFVVFLAKYTALAGGAILIGALAGVVVGALAGEPS